MSEAATHNRGPPPGERNVDDADPPVHAGGEVAGVGGGGGIPCDSPAPRTNQRTGVRPIS
jgi:hypothetical protein